LMKNRIYVIGLQNLDGLMGIIPFVKS